VLKRIEEVTQLKKSIESHDKELSQKSSTVTEGTQTDASVQKCEDMLLLIDRIQKENQHLKESLEQSESKLRDTEFQLIASKKERGTVDGLTNGRTTDKAHRNGIVSSSTARKLTETKIEAQKDGSGSTQRSSSMRMVLMVFVYGVATILSFLGLCYILERVEADTLWFVVRPFPT